VGYEAEIIVEDAHQEYEPGSKDELNAYVVIVILTLYGVYTPLKCAYKYSK